MFRTLTECQRQRRYLDIARRDGTPERFFEDVRGAAREGAFARPEDFSLRYLFEAFIDDGRELCNEWRTPEGRDRVRLSEAGVSTADFANISGQIVYSMILEAFTGPEFIADQLCRTVSTDLSGEKIAGITQLGDDAEEIGEGKPYPVAGVGERYVETPATTKRGMIVPVTKEAIFFDKTGKLLESCSDASRALAISKEKRVLDMVLGVTSLYRLNGAAAIATYGENSGSHDWNNLAVSNGLSDYTDIETALLLFEDLVDPDNGEPIVLDAKDILIPGSLKMTAKHILAATEFRKATSSAANTAIGDNPLSGYSFNLMTSPYVKARLSAGSIAVTTWYIGDFKKAFAYMENWPITAVDAPPNSEMEFTNDIVARYKVSERGGPAVLEPRAVVKSTA